MARKLPDGVVKSFPVRIDTRPIRSTDPDHYHAFRASVALKDLPTSHSLETWFKQTSTPDSKWFVTTPVDKSKYTRRPPRFHEVTQDGSRARFLISPGRFEPYKHKGAASYVGTAYEMQDGSVRWPAAPDRRDSKNPTRTIGQIAGITGKVRGKTKREKIAALDADTDVSDNTYDSATIGGKPTLLSEEPMPSFKGLHKKPVHTKQPKGWLPLDIRRDKPRAYTTAENPIDKLWDIPSRVIRRITRPDRTVVEVHEDGHIVEIPPRE